MILYYFLILNQPNQFNLNLFNKTLIKNNEKSTEIVVYFFLKK